MRYETYGMNKVGMRLRNSLFINLMFGPVPYLCLNLSLSLDLNLSLGLASP